MKRELQNPAKVDVNKETLARRLREIRNMEEDLDAKKDQILRYAGWEHTCQTPGSYWMWKKEVDGVTYLCNQSTALTFVEHLK